MRRRIGRVEGDVFEKDVEFIFLGISGQGGEVATGSVDDDEQIESRDRIIRASWSELRDSSRDQTDQGLTRFAGSRRDYVFNVSPYCGSVEDKHFENKTIRM